MGKRVGKQGPAIRGYISNTFALEAPNDPQPPFLVSVGVARFVRATRRRYCAVPTTMSTDLTDAASDIAADAQGNAYVLGYRNQDVNRDVNSAPAR